MEANAFAISCFSRCFDQMPDMRQLNGRRISSDLGLQEMQSIVVGKAGSRQPSDRNSTSSYLLISQHNQERGQTRAVQAIDLKALPGEHLIFQLDPAS